MGIANEEVTHFILEEADNELVVCYSETKCGVHCWMSRALYPGHQLRVQVGHLLLHLPDLQAVGGVQAVRPGQLQAGGQGNFLPGERVRCL